MSTTLSPVLPPEQLEQARHLVARAARLVSGTALGIHRSRRLGGGSEFAQHKVYSPGDDLKHLDWKVLGRTDRYVVKQFETDRRTEVSLLIDRSRSMGFGTTSELGRTAGGVEWPGSKWEAARMMALALAFVFLRQGDRVGLTLADGGTRSVIPPRGGEQHLGELTSTLLESDPRGRASLKEVLQEVRIRTRRGLIVLLSDLLDEDGSWIDALAVHTARGREAWVLHVVDPAEISFPYDEPSRFVDLEGAGELSLNPREIARSYREEFAAFLEAQRQSCLGAGVHYLRLVTDRPLDELLASFLRERTWA